MSSFSQGLVDRYARAGILVDTNLFLLWLVGIADRTRITTFKRTDKFVPEDFDTLDYFLGQFQKRVTTPNILTEVSNLANVLDGKPARVFARAFSQAIRSMDETYVPSITVSDPVQLAKFGLTDCGIVKVLNGQYLLRTDDFRLSQYVSQAGGDAVNFNHIRRQNWE